MGITQGVPESPKAKKVGICEKPLMMRKRGVKKGHRFFALLSLRQSPHQISLGKWGRKPS